MMLVYPPAGLEVSLPLDKVQSIVIENPKLYYEITYDIYSQINGQSGDTVISENYVPVQLNKSADMATQFVPFTAKRKDIISAVCADLKVKSVNDTFYTPTQEMYSYIEKYLYSLVEDVSAEVDFDRPEDISAVLKAFNLHIVETDKRLHEKYLEYVLALREYKKISVFITAGLRDYITNKEAEDLFQSVLLNEIALICIESKASDLLKNETRVIIDNDMCVI